jgi:hypothetical protein
MKLPHQVSPTIKRANHHAMGVASKGVQPSQCQCAHGFPVGTAANNFGCPPGAQAYCRGNNQCVCTTWTFGDIPGNALQQGPLYKGGEFAHR